MKGKLIEYIKWFVVILLIGKGVLHFTADQPYAFIFGNDELVSYLFGSLLVLFGILAALPVRVLTKGWWIYLFMTPSLLLILQSYAAYIQAGYVLEQFIELTLQMALPLTLVYLIKGKHQSTKKKYYLLTVLVALTFVGHALFAIGFNYLPGNFLEMTTRSLPWMSNENAVSFLFIIGVVDIVCAICAFIPQLRKGAIWYLIIWGLLTSVARTYYAVDEGFVLDLLTNNIPNTIYRLPHGLVPFVMLLLAYELDAQVQQKKILTPL
jgi:uncharacterized membrane protein